MAGFFVCLYPLPTGERTGERHTGTGMIQVDSLSKQHKKQWLLRNISFQVQPGELFALGGHNGAGKSLLLQILAGLVRPSSGEATIAGYEVASNSQEVKRRVGYVGVVPTGYDDSLVEEYLEFWASAHGLPKDMRRTVVEDGLGLCDLERVQRVRLADLSAGMRQRVELARSVLHDPPALLLDSPLQGLDVQGTADWIAIVQELAALGKAVILASAQLWQWFPVCHRVGLLCDGRLVAQGTLEDLWNEYEVPYLTVVRISQEDVGPDRLEPLVGVVQVASRKQVFRISHTNPPEQLLQTLVQEGLSVVEFRSDWQGLEQALLAANGSGTLSTRV